MIALACDHGGFDLMQEIKSTLTQMGREYTDFGTWDKNSCDYPQFAIPAARAVASGQCECAILVCGTGVGMSIVANKIPQIRAALCSDTYTAQMTRRHNDANILTMGARVIDAPLALKIVETFLTTPFEGERHARRLAMIDELDKNRGSDNEICTANV